MCDPDHVEGKLEDCFWAVIERFEDGYVLCAAKENGMKCEDCIEAWKRLVKYE